MIDREKRFQGILKSPENAFATESEFPDLILQYHHNIENRLTLPYHPWTNGQVERMNRTIKEAIVKKYYYQTHDKLKEHLQSFIEAYNSSKRLKALNGLTVFDYINKCWHNEPQRFKLNPLHMLAKPYKYKPRAQIELTLNISFVYPNFLNLGKR